MPCDSIQTVSVHLGKLVPALRDKALKELGAKNIFTAGNSLFFKLDGIACQITKDGDFLVSKGCEHLRDKLKRAYTKQMYVAIAQKTGKKLRQIAPNKYVLSLK